MVPNATSYDFSAVIDGFFAQKKITGVYRELLSSTIRDQALTLLSHPDVRYMPAFKILDILAAFVNIAAAIAEARQLRPIEVRALLRESFSGSTPLIRQFLLEAALERARYEPLMFEGKTKNAPGDRVFLLHRRWSAMRTAHQENAPLPDHWMGVVDEIVEQAIASEIFVHFRQGPLLQMFAEMLGLARDYKQREQTLNDLKSALSQQGALWRRYALKSLRYGEKLLPATDINLVQPRLTIH